MPKKMNQVEWKLISELLNDSRNSDRELSKRLGVSQPTVSRMRHRLEKEGYLREYTIMPDFRKLGFNLAAICFVKYKVGLNSKQAEEMRKRAMQRFADQSFAPNVILFERGLGFGHTGMLVSFHEDYSSFAEFLKQIRQFTVLDQEIKTFLIDLNDDVHYRSLSFVPLAHCILNRFKKEAT
jgi:DNA-binding Lrp family transcriptional regulator